jgi:hypothetical protein
MVVILGLAFYACGTYYSYGCPVSNTLSGKFWGMPYNLTSDQETTPWFKEPTLLSWLSLIASVPAAFAALWGLRKVEKSLETISNVINVTSISSHNFSFKVPQKDDQIEIETFIGKKVKIFMTSEPHNYRKNPVEGILISENFHTILLKTDEKIKTVIFKHAISTIEEIKEIPK